MENKIYVITGASGTLGTELLSQLNPEKNFIFTISHINKLKSNNNLYNYNYDISTENKYTKLIKDINRINSNEKINEIILIHCAGIYEKFDFENGKNFEIWEKMNSINFISFIKLFKLLLPEMKRINKSQVITITTNLLKRKNKNSGPYISSKAALKEITEQLAYDYGKYNILLNSFELGYFESNLNINTGIDTEKILINIPIKRNITAQEIAKIIIGFIEINTCITGQSLTIDGGNTIGYEQKV